MPAPTAQHAAARAFVEQHAGFVSRVLWGAGVPRAALDDATQQVFMVALERLGELRDERAFLFAVATRIAKATRRTEARLEPVEDAERAEQMEAEAPPADELLSQKQLRERLDALLQSIPEELRTVFVLFEIEAMTMKEIAEAMELAPGTVASRLRRARELFQAGARRMRAQSAREEGA